MSREEELHNKPIIPVDMPSRPGVISKYKRESTAPSSSKNSFSPKIPPGAIPFDNVTHNTRGRHFRANKSIKGIRYSGRTVSTKKLPLGDIYEDPCAKDEELKLKKEGVWEKAAEKAYKNLIGKLIKEKFDPKELIEKYHFLASGVDAVQKELERLKSSDTELIVKSGMGMFSEAVERQEWGITINNRIDDGDTSLLHYSGFIMSREKHPVEKIPNESMGQDEQSKRRPRKRREKSTTIVDRGHSDKDTMPPEKMAFYLDDSNEPESTTQLMPDPPFHDMNPKASPNNPIIPTDIIPFPSVIIHSKKHLPSISAPAIPFPIPAPAILFPIPPPAIPFPYVTHSQKLGCFRGIKKMINGKRYYGTIVDTKELPLAGIYEDPCAKYKELKLKKGGVWEEAARKAYQNLIMKLLESELELKKSNKDFDAVDYLWNNFSRVEVQRVAYNICRIQIEILFRFGFSINQVSESLDFVVEKDEVSTVSSQLPFECSKNDVIRERPSYNFVRWVDEVNKKRNQVKRLVFPNDSNASSDTKQGESSVKTAPPHNRVSVIKDCRIKDIKDTGADKSRREVSVNQRDFSLFPSNTTRNSADQSATGTNSKTKKVSRP